ncbi:hypothetical protein ASG17_01920 [Brevundimonas sp. Leaf363]|uniref:hypothetical protein n=1 Tax=Brevundimonas sp. Leaf363 TaxID=1736353 RepID=UPI0006FAA6AC|nr:hypothetical protein [Brevundimonas sp. Leaf363]KQS57498.1 hypothetical protein ASG17_01920 [Brevundimonas sp. Leaf363]
MTDMAPTPRRIRPDSVWNDAREDYLIGFTAQEVCRRHDLGLSAFWARAQREGWRRADQPAPDPVDDALDPDAPVASREQAIDKAWRRVDAALDAGRSTDALRWMRIHAMLLAGERADMREGDRRSMADLRQATEAARGRSAATVAVMQRVQTEIDIVDAQLAARRTRDQANEVESKNALDPDEPGLNRAERRRRRRLSG